MGTTLTGTTPQDTYDSLIKVTDNGPLTTSLKVLTDGLGNDSTLSLSQTAASIAGTLAVASNATFDTNTLIVDATNNRVGVGTVTTTQALTVNGNAAVGGQQAFWLRDDDGFSANAARRAWAITANYATLGTLSIYGGSAANSDPLAGTAFLNITSDGNVGIGTSTASRLLTLKNNAGATNGISFQSSATTSEIAAIECNQTIDTIDFEMVSNFAGNGFRFLTGSPTLVERARFTANGLTFNGDTAAANALDDYEEGTWTLGLSFGGGTTGIAYSANSGTYTKIGRQVTVNGYIALSSKGSSAGSVAITGLPFPIPSTSPYYAPPSLWLNNVSFANQFIGYTQLSTSQIRLNELTEAGVFSDLTDGNFANNSEIMVSMTYFV